MSKLGSGPRYCPACKDTYPCIIHDDDLFECSICQTEFRIRRFHIGVCVGGHSVRRNTEDGPIEQWVETFYVGASDDRGHNWALFGSDSENEADAHAALVTLGDKTPETHRDLWVQTQPTYGSDAWDAQAEYDLACAEAEAFGEPIPRWPR